MKAWELIEKGWCQLDYARDEYENPVDIDDSDAVKWCLVGALDRIYPDFTENTIMLTKVKNAIDLIAMWNDDRSRTKEEVVNLLKRLDV